MKNRLITSQTLQAPISSVPHDKPAAVQVGSSVAEAVNLMSEKDAGAVIVVEEGVLVGIFTERDYLKKVFVRGLDPSDIPIQEVMTPAAECLQFDDPVAFALNLMSVGHFRHVPLVDESCRPMGMISVKDVFRHIVGKTRSQTPVKD